ncbi:MAG: NFACT RNA binding domain-containing protein [Gloeomargarita sp. SKYBB_i_bin120]|nr:NFACT family protein [Gloeomargarita sp. SKYG98]MCS7292097.1 NFACT family protein [Gloeomargarita sp. SKYB120]MDW8177657.1 NFACT RNA binding domain-containing protein [Gloeomargarita sp. SKYBB_i_bin120]
MTLQPCDLTTLVAVCQELYRDWLPARLERVIQTDKHHLYLGLRTLERRGWWLLSWHPQAARLHRSDGPPDLPDTFTFSQQLWHQLGQLALTDLRLLDPWERVVVLSFAPRPGESPHWHLYLEVMGRYSNAILTQADGTIVTCAHQVSAQESRVRPLQTGDRYQPPPALTQTIPRLEEPFAQWHQRLTVLPLPLRRALLASYRGLSGKLVREMAAQLALDPETPVTHLTPAQWQHLWELWQSWLRALQAGQFTPGFTDQGYTVLGWGITQPVPNVSHLLQQYYHHHLTLQALQHQRQHLQQKLHQQQQKLRQKLHVFQEKLRDMAQAETYRQQADLLMAHLHLWAPGMTEIHVPDFAADRMVTLTIPPDQTALQAAQALYKRYQKLKRAGAAVVPLLADVQTQLAYLEQIATQVEQLEAVATEDALALLAEIYQELAQQGYDWQPATYRPRPRPTAVPFLTFTSPGGHPIYVGRNNRQNEALTFSYAGDYDWWFHAQEIPGSHVLLRLPAGVPLEDADVQAAANIAAYYSRSRRSQQVPVIYTRARYVQRLKGYPPGTVHYRHEQVVWGYPDQAPIAQSTWQHPQQPQRQPR